MLRVAHRHVPADVARSQPPLSTTRSRYLRNRWAERNWFVLRIRRDAPAASTAIELIRVSAAAKSRPARHGGFVFADLMCTSTHVNGRDLWSNCINARRRGNIDLARSLLHLVKEHARRTPSRTFTKALRFYRDAGATFSARLWPGQE